MLLSPDGIRYLAIADGQRVPRPFHYRWLIPALAGRNGRAWQALQIAALLGMVALSVAYNDDWKAGVAAGLAMFGLAGITLNLRLPVLVDLPAMSLALAAAVIADTNLPAAIALAVAAGACKETSPVFAAAYAWNPWLLAGLLAPALRHLWKTGPDMCEGLAAEALTHPLKVAWQVRKGRWTDPKLWLLPWGGLTAGLYQPTWQVAVTLALAYSQCVLATDTVRLYQWAWPVLAAHTFTVLPPAWWPLAVAATIWNPYAGNGI